MAIGGSKHFGFVKLRPDLQPVKVVTVTLGHPVAPIFEQDSAGNP